MAYPSHKLDDRYYSILGLARSASPSAIRSAYRKLAMIWHPDKCRSEDLAAGAGAKLKFHEIQEAYTVLSDVRKRGLYDNGLYDPNDDEEDIEGLSSLLNEISSKIAEIKAAEHKNNGKVKNFEEFQQLFASIFNTDHKMAHVSGLYPATEFRYPAHQPIHFTYPASHPTTASLNNKRDRQLYEASLPSERLGSEYLYYDFFDIRHASPTTAKKTKHDVEQEDRRSVRP